MYVGECVLLQNLLVVESFVNRLNAFVAIDFMI